MNAEVLKEIMDMEANNDFDIPRYNELLLHHFYTEHILRKPLKEWPKSIKLAFERLNQNIYIYVQGHSEFGMIANASFKNWDVSKPLKEIKTPTLMLGAKHDTMDPKYMEWMAMKFKTEEVKPQMEVNVLNLMIRKPTSMDW